MEVLYISIFEFKIVILIEYAKFIVTNNLCGRHVQQAKETFENRGSRIFQTEE